MKYLHTHGSPCATWTPRWTSTATSWAWWKPAGHFDNAGGRFTLVFLCAPDDAERTKTEDQRPAGRADLYNWDPEGLRWRSPALTTAYAGG